MLAAILLAGLVDTVGFWALVIVGVCAIVALVAIALRKFNVAIPDWVQQVFWVIVVFVVIAAAIMFVVNMAGGQPSVWLRGP